MDAGDLGEFGILLQRLELRFYPQFIDPLEDALLKVGYLHIRTPLGGGRRQLNGQ